MGDAVIGGHMAEVSVKIVEMLKTWVANKRLWRRVICTVLILAAVASLILFVAFRSCEVTNEGGAWKIKSQTTLKAKVPHVGQD